MPAIEEILQAGRAAIRAPDQDKAVELVADYCDLVDKFDAAVSGASRAEVEALILVHREVVARAEALQANAQQGMRTVHQRAKGLIAYIDGLPKRVSLGDTKKG